MTPYKNRITIKCNTVYMAELLQSVLGDKGTFLIQDYVGKATNLNLDFDKNRVTRTYGVYANKFFTMKKEYLNEIKLVPVEALQHYLESLV